VDDAPWGFAPFHYGRWVSWGGRWCWAPGPYVHRPVYAPALVGWVGGGSVSVGISIGGRPAPPRYGWYPLAPREVYMPAYRHSPRYVNRINDPRDVRDPVTVQRPHRYREVPTAISVLPAAGAAIQPLPVRGPDRRVEPGWVKPLPVAPGRNDLAAVLPAAPTRPAERDLPRQQPVRGVEPGMGWRSDSQLPLRRDTARPAPEAPAVQPAMPAAPGFVPPQMPQAQPRPPAEPARVVDPGMPWRAQQPDARRDDRREDRRDDRREGGWGERRDEPRRSVQPMPTPMPVPMPQAEPPRSMPMPERVAPAMDLPRRVEPPQRQIEPPRMQMPAPQPQVQAPRNDAPQRGRQDGVPVRGGGDTRRSDQPHQQER
jgi:hypothetical protein